MSLPEAVKVVQVAVVTEEQRCDIAATSSRLPCRVETDMPEFAVVSAEDAACACWWEGQWHRAPCRKACTLLHLLRARAVIAGLKCLVWPLSHAEPIFFALV